MDTVMKLLIETWVRVESIVEANSKTEAYSIVLDCITTEKGRKEIVNSAKCEGIIRCYDLATGENVGG